MSPPTRQRPGLDSRGVAEAVSTTTTTYTAEDTETVKSTFEQLDLLFPSNEERRLRGLRCPQCRQVGEPTTAGGRAARLCPDHRVVWFQEVA